jgi:peptidoglycan/xylan/chitin deacetylase (PgdA/CDA1 family)
MLPLAKTAALDASRILGINRMARRLLRQRLLVLGYHGVVTDDRKDRFRYTNTVSVREFRTHLEFLRRHFHPVSTADVRAWRSGAAELPPNPVLVTFDDGYRNNLLAGEILKEYGIPAVFFMTTGYIGAKRVLWPDEVVHRLLAWPDATIPLPDGREEKLPRENSSRRQAAWRVKEQCKKIPTAKVETYLDLLRKTPVATDENEELFGFMDWSEVRKLRGLGFEIGSHTAEHPILTRIDAKRLEQELRESKQKLEEELGEPCLAIAYPNGGPEDVSTPVFEGARRAGYDLGFTVAERHSAPGEDGLAISRQAGEIQDTRAVWVVCGSISKGRIACRARRRKLHFSKGGVAFLAKSCRIRASISSSRRSAEIRSRRF